MNTNQYINVEMQQMQQEMLDYFRTRWKFFWRKAFFLWCSA